MAVKLYTALQLRVCIANAEHAQVATFRRWLDEYGGEVPTCTAADAAALGPPLPKEQVRACGGVCV